MALHVLSGKQFDLYDIRSLHQECVTACMEAQEGKDM